MDNGTECMTKNITNLLRDEKINCNKTPPYISNLNGTAERFNHKLKEKMESFDN